MIELNAMMKQCLIDSHNDYPDLDYIDTVMRAFASYVNFVGAPIEMESEEEGEEFLKKAVFFLVDCVLVDMVAKGIVEVDGMDPDGELVYKVTAEF